MAFRLDPERGVSTQQCDQCGAEYRVITGFVFRDDDAFAVYKAALHTHAGVNEVWIDVILGSWDEGQEATHTTFGCRIGPFGDGGDYAGALVAAAVPYSDSPLFGRKLDRNEALEHPWLADFWEVVDFLLAEDAEISLHTRVE